jgi:hypothetical protein
MRIWRPIRQETMRRIYAFLGVRYPGDQIVSDVHPQSVGKGRVSTLSPAIDQLCADLLERLNQHNNRIGPKSWIRRPKTPI